MTPPSDGSRPDDAPGMDHETPSLHSPSAPEPDAPQPDATEQLRLDEPAYDESADEQALRGLMRDAVRDLSGSPDALDHLRRAIPVRRQRRRQALVGAAAAVVLAGMAVPALVHAAGGTGGSSAAPAGVVTTHTVAPDASGHLHHSGGPSGQPSPGADSTPTQHHSTPGPGDSATPPASPSTTGAPAPECSSAQLGQGASSAGTSDADGRVYGWFRLANVSGTPCTVSGGGVVQAVAQGAADSARIQVVAHTAGDPAGALPDASGGPLVLAPGQDYEVRFAWIPDSGGPGGCIAPSSPPASPTPTDTPTDPGTDGGGATTGTGAVANDVDAPASGTDPTTAPTGSVALSNTPAAGAPVVTGPVIPDVCAGTVYTTPALPSDSDTPAP